MTTAQRALRQVRILAGGYRSWPSSEWPGEGIRKLLDGIAAICDIELGAATREPEPGERVTEHRIVNGHVEPPLPHKPYRYTGKIPAPETGADEPAPPDASTLPPMRNEAYTPATLAAAQGPGRADGLRGEDNPEADEYRHALRMAYFAGHQERGGSASWPSFGDWWDRYGTRLAAPLRSAPRDEGRALRATLNARITALSAARDKAKAAGRKGVAECRQSDVETLEWVLGLLAPAPTQREGETCAPEDDRPPTDAAASIGMLAPDAHA